MIRSLEGWPTKAKEAPSPHEVRLILLNTNPVFQCLRESLEFNRKVWKPHIWVIFYNFCSFLPKRGFFQNNLAVMHDPARAPNTILSFIKTNGSVPRKLPYRWKGGCKGRQKDEETWTHRAPLATMGERDLILCITYINSKRYWRYENAIQTIVVLF